MAAVFQSCRFGHFRFVHKTENYVFCHVVVVVVVVVVVGGGGGGGAAAAAAAAAGFVVVFEDRL